MAEKKGGGGSKKAASTTGKTQEKKQKEKKSKIKTNPAGSRMKDEIIAVILVALGIFIIIAELTDATGQVGHVLSTVFKGCFGPAAYILPFYLIVYALLVLTNRTAHINSRTVVFTIILFLDIDMLLSIRYSAVKTPYFGVSYIADMFRSGVLLDSAGAVGMSIGWGLVKLVDITGLVLVGIVVIIICAILIANTPVSVFFDNQRIKRNQKRIDALAEKTESGTSDPLSDTMPLPVLPDEGQETKGKKGSKKKKDRPSGGQESSTLPDSDPAPSVSAAGAGVSEIPAQDSVKSVSDDSSADSLSSRLPSFLTGRKKEKEDKTAPIPGTSDAKGSSTVFRGSDNRRQILDYMNDDSLFGQGNGSGSGDDPAKGLGFAYEDLGKVKPAEVPTFEVSSFGEGPGAAFEKSEPEQPFNGQNIDYETGEILDDPVPDAGNFEDTAAVNNDADVIQFPDEAASAQKLREAAGDIKGTAGKAADLAGDLDAAAASVSKVVQDAEKVKTTAKDVAKAAASVREAAGAPGGSVSSGKQYKLPPLDLLNKTERKSNPGGDAELRNSAATLERVLHDFGVDARVTNVNRGPAVTRYEVQPATGVKVSKIVSLSDDIALNLRAKSLRIEAPIPGKAAVGIEVQNDHSEIVSLREMIGSREFQQAKSKISFVVGEDVTGRPVVADLKGMPHMLIAGSTGSGKSVCINSIILSLLYEATPDEVKLILIDPKVVELGNYNGIPHMLIPVVTDPAKAAAALAWAVQEMEARYKKFAKEKVKDLKSFNKKMRSEAREDEVMPQIVIIIDELADLMMAAAKQVEESICRLAQLARAAGMHMVVATQRPSVDVVTGLIKANVPSRIAFAVSSQVDSRTILDRAGAEKLVGKGDMLFSPLGAAQPERLQGPFVTDEEVAAVIDFWKAQEGGEDGAQENMQQVMQEINTVSTGFMSSDDDEDELFGDAVDLVLNAGQASASMLQRRFRIGYNRAGRLIDMMEAKGIIGPSEGSKPRKVLVTKEEYQAASSGAAAGSSGSGNTAEGN